MSIEPTELFSVILPTCNRPKLFVDALTSLVDQTDLNYEIVIVDNGCDPETLVRAEELVSTRNPGVCIKYLPERRAGLVYCRHTGIVAGNGTIFAFTDDDGYYESNWVSEIRETFRMFPEAVAVGTKIDIEWDESPNSDVRSQEEALGKINLASDRICRQDLFINGGSMAVRRDVLFEVKGFNPGQCGEYLLGDSETGLCRKLHSLGHFIAWTPFTTMHHRQFRSKHGSLEDLLRRATNNGIATAFDIVFGNRGFLRGTVHAILQLVVKVLFLLATHVLRRKSAQFDLRISIRTSVATLVYIVQFLFNRDLRRRVLRRDSNLDGEYQLLEPVCVLTSTRISS